MSHWYYATIKVQKMVLFTITKAQTDDGFTGGGVLPINMDTFGSVRKTAIEIWICVLYIKHILGY